MLVQITVSASFQTYRILTNFNSLLRYSEPIRKQKNVNKKFIVYLNIKLNVRGFFLNLEMSYTLKIKHRN